MTKDNTRRVSLDRDNLRQRLATPTRSNARGRDIGHVWATQKRLQEERWKLAPDDRHIWQEAKKLISKSYTRIKKSYKNKKIITSFSLAIKNHFKNILNKARKKPKTTIVVAILFIALTPLMLIAINGKEANTPKSLGAKSEGSTGNKDGKTEEAPPFKILHPSDRTELLEVTRRTPTGVLLHTYQDMIEGTEIEVTQQQIPESFEDSPVTELEKMAKEFQATDIIQVDEAIIYHGLNEKTQVQSLFTFKKEVLISIRSAVKFSDDIWAAYYLSLE